MKRKFLLLIIFIFGSVFQFCGNSNSNNDDIENDADADSDSDTDTDIDSDSDTDSDTDADLTYDTQIDSLEDLAVDINLNDNSQCIDNDGDSYGENCSLGSDCDDTTTSCTTDCSDNDNNSIPDCRETTQIITFGGIEDDEPRSIIQTNDGGFVVVGRTFSYGVLHSDIWIVKFNSNLETLWQESIGDIGYEVAESIVETTNGDLILVGRTTSFGAGEDDAWIIKLDSQGNILWQKTLGGTEYEEIKEVIETSAGNFIMVGSTGPIGDGNRQIWIVKFDTDGNILWQKEYGSSNYDIAESIIESNGGGFIVVGKTYFIDTDQSDIWVLKIDSNGELIWNSTIGGFFSETGESVVETSDGNIFIAGKTYTYIEDPREIWIVKLGSDGNILWQKYPVATSNDNLVESIITTQDGNLLIGGNISGNIDSSPWHMWITKINTDGNIIWQKMIAGGEDDFFKDMIESNDGNLLIIGDSDSFNSSLKDFLIVKLNSDGQFNGQCGIIYDTNSTMSDTQESALQNNITPQDTNLTLIESTAVPMNSDATLSVQCPE